MVLEYIIILIRAGDSLPDLVMVGLLCRFIRILHTGDLADTDTVTDMVIEGAIIMDTIMDTGQGMPEAGTIPEMFINKDHLVYDPQPEIV